MKNEQVALTENLNSFSPADKERILNAIEVCAELAAEPVAVTVIDLGLDADAVIAALVIGNDKIGSEKIAQLQDRFGASVQALVKGVEKIGRLPVDNKTLREAQNIRDMIFALTDDIRAIIIKLAQKLQTLRQLDSYPAEERKATARECIEIYAPLANRLGISRLKDELEDLSLKFVNREAYQQIKSIVAQKKDQRGVFLTYVQDTIRAEAAEAGFTVEVKSRAKHFYSIYMKMRKRGKTADEIYDLFGIRIICDSIENCYTLLGVVHRLWAPVRGCFDDYVANPKPNGYQSLHTSVLVDADDGEERRLEIQIRTKEMHQMAENGVASHWLYKQSSGSSKDSAPATPKATATEFSGDWLAEIKHEILQNWIYVLTPQGKVVRLPSGATPIDFAYSVHTAIGERCIGAKVNGSIIPLSAELKNTQVVEILTNASARPHIGWLETVKTSKARNKIRSWLEQHESPHAHEKLEKAEKEKSEKSAEKKKPADTPPAIPDEQPMQMILQPLKSVLQVRVEDEKNLLIHFARCCNPITGDLITGYVSRGRGIIIHRQNCRNLANNPELENRRIDVAWENSGSSLVKRFKIDARQTANLFSEIEGAIRRRQGHLIEGRLEEVPGAGGKGAGRLGGFFTIQLVNAEDLKAVMKNIRGIPGIIGIQQLN
jgi:GTP pyrophosphokinase